MSPLSSAAARPLAPPAGPRPAPAPRVHLELVPAPIHSQSRAPFLIMCMSILIAAMLGALVLNTSMARTSFAISDLRVQLSQVAQDSQDLQTKIWAANADLDKKARALGMVPAGTPQMLRLSDGAVLGGTTTP